eukprot:Hpha_TRINITY_DN15447_c0_g1::TRINITY_DN15447_c0_g1_i1::g.175371::m.175371/K19177/NUS1; dehydrodolichyl diphosphate syntase complex subunit NUS1
MSKAPAALPQQPTGLPWLFLALLNFVEHLWIRLEAWFWWFVMLAFSVVRVASGGCLNPLLWFIPTRLPSHIAIVLEEDNTAAFYASGCKLVRWLFELAGVRYITLYSSSWSREDLGPTANLAAKRAADMGFNTVAYAGGRFVGDYRGGKDKAARVVSAVGQAEGKPALVNAALAVAGGEVQGIKRVEELSEGQLGRLLPTAAGGAPDPELLLVFGKVDSVYGFPPWTLAVTELRFHRNLRHFTKAQLLRDLRHFASVKTVKGV